MPMHRSANIGASSNVALFFSLSGTGKTTLPSDPTQRLIGDDEHGGSDQASSTSRAAATPRRSTSRKEPEPEIYAATNHCGTILENVSFDPETRGPD